MGVTSWYAGVLSRQPCAIILLVAVLSCCCCLLPFLTNNLPDFTDPTQGFQTRGTDISDRLITWENLIEETRASGSLAGNPKDILDEIEYMKSRNRSTYKPKTRNGKKKRPKDAVNKIKKKLKNSNNTVNKVVFTDTLSDLERFDENGTFEEHEHFGYGKNLSYLAKEGLEGQREYNRNNWASLKNMNFATSYSGHDHLSSDGYFCGVPMPDYAHVVVSTVDGSSLLSAPHLRSVCRLQSQLEEAGGAAYGRLCQRTQPVSGAPCCRQWSLPNYVALLANVSSCMDITDELVSQVVMLLSHCSPYFHSLKLASDCEAERCSSPPSCYKYNAVFSILSYMVDVDFLPPTNKSVVHVSSSMIFLPLACSASILPYYHMIQDVNFQHDNVSVVAMNLGVKNAVFDLWLVHDTWLLGLGFLFVLCCMWTYCGSLLLTLCTCAAILFSLGIAYFLYTTVFNLSFFPFMNLLTVIVAVGIGADDMFIFTKVWQSVSSSSSSLGLTRVGGRLQLQQVMEEALQQGVLPMLTTSLTTMAAFYAQAISHITAITCFSIFTGTVVLVNFLLMMTWLPAWIIVVETCCSSLKSFGWFVGMRSVRQSVEDTWSMLNRFLVVSVIRLRWLWLLLLGTISVLSAVSVLHWPGLKLPDSRSFQLFHSTQVFEQYDLFYRENYWFERSIKEWGGGGLLPLRWVWGVLPRDSGSPLLPGSRGPLALDPSFSPADPASQLFLLDFCLRLKGQPFYQSTLGPLLPNCFIENFVTWMTRKCLDEIDKLDRSPCCEVSTFPYTKLVFDTCIVRAISDLYQTPEEYFMPGVAGPKFSKVTSADGIPRIAAIVVEFESNYSFSVSYENMEQFYLQVENWTQTEMTNAPPGMKNGWFVSDLEFYDLQRTLSRGTLTAIIVSMSVALLVLLIVTLNILISLYAIVTITMSISVTVGILVLLGWRLNILESLAVSTAIGLAVDFSLHIGLAYRRAEGTRETRTARALAAAASPTAMAALTTGIAGALMIPARVLPYTQIGIFLVVVMLVSWVYSTFFLGSLLCVFGPLHKFGQFEYPGLKRNRGTISSCSSAGLGVSGSAAGALVEVPLPPEGHELQPLPAQQRRVPTAHDQSPSATSAITIIMADEDCHR